MTRILKQEQEPVSGSDLELIGGGAGTGEGSGGQDQQGGGPDDGENL